MNRADQRRRHRERIAEVRSGTAPRPIRTREAEVLRTGPIGSGLLPGTLGGPGMAGFESHAPDEHVKLLFPEAGKQPRLPVPDSDLLRWPQPLTMSLEYAVRRYDSEAGELDLDITVHDCGSATAVATRRQSGA
ncbi:siderophore-interacting protein [Amycolatopsis silviterrae]|uniref:Siderophore-interacting protein n=1 Tax=Amycolatopsis silviterrae TaxID=1656914 RepID=A0ABW5HP33_9PSEU